MMPKMRTLDFVDGIVFCFAALLAIASADKLPPPRPKKEPSYAENCNPNNWR